MRMMRRHRRPLRAITIDENRVLCPRSPGDTVDVEKCYACPLLERLDTSDGEDWITCKASVRRADPFFGSIPS